MDLPVQGMFPLTFHWCHTGAKVVGCVCTRLKIMLVMSQTSRGSGTSSTLLLIAVAMFGLLESLLFNRNILPSEVPVVLCVDNHGQSKGL